MCASFMVTFSGDVLRIPPSAWQAGLTVKGFAEIIKQTPNSITNHAKSGEVPSHLAIIATLMGEMAENGQDFKATLSRIQCSSSKKTRRMLAGSPLSKVLKDVGNTASVKGTNE